MSFDFFAEHEITEPDVSNKNWQKNYKFFSRIQLLANCLWNERKVEVQNGVYRDWLQGMTGQIREQLNEMDGLGIPYSQNIDWGLLPSNSWLLTVDFRLSGHLMTKDDNQYYIIENPICKDTAFKVPMMRPSSWKGYLRWACVRKLAEDVQRVETATNAIRDIMVRSRVQLSLLFGNERGVDLDTSNEQGYLDELFAGKFCHISVRQYRDILGRIAPEGSLAGKLHFYPAFFDKIDLDIINPHDPEKKSGGNPILMEIVPGKRNPAQGKFVLLYAPLYHGYNANYVFTAKEDLLVIIQALEQLMIKYGFSAKRTSRYGVVTDIKGTLQGPNLAGIMPGNANLRNGVEFSFRGGFGQLLGALG